MPAAVAAIPVAAATLGGAIIGHKGQSKALKSQERAQREALAYEREQSAKAEAAALRREKLEEQVLNEWRQRQDAVLKRYGISRSSPYLSFGSQGGPPGAAPGGMSPGMMQSPTGRGPVRLKSVGLAPAMQPMVNPYDLEGWDA